jgi:hypothetical protein
MSLVKAHKFNVGYFVLKIILIFWYSCVVDVWPVNSCRDCSRNVSHIIVEVKFDACVVIFLWCVHSNPKRIR